VVARAAAVRVEGSKCPRSSQVCRSSRSQEWTRTVSWCMSCIPSWCRNTTASQRRAQCTGRRLNRWCQSRSHNRRCRYMQRKGPDNYCRSRCPRRTRRRNRAHSRYRGPQLRSLGGTHSNHTGCSHSYTQQSQPCSQPRTLRHKELSCTHPGRRNYRCSRGDRCKAPGRTALCSQVSPQECTQQCSPWGTGMCIRLRIPNGSKEVLQCHTPSCTPVRKGRCSPSCSPARLHTWDLPADPRTPPLNQCQEGNACRHRYHLHSPQRSQWCTQ